jgi:hypothetical protein
VPYLHSRDQWVTWMTVGVIVLGALATLTALAKSSSVKWLTAGITASIAIIGGVKSQILHADVESYGGLALTTEVWIKHVKDNVNAFEAAKALAPDGGRLSDETRGLFEANFKQSLSEWQQIDERAKKLQLSFEVTRPGVRIVTWRLPGEATLLAAGQTPQQAQQQVQQTAKSVGRYIQRGTGICSTVFAASEYARFDGRRRLALQLQPTASGRSLDALIASLDGSAVDQVDKLTVDPATRLATQVTQVSLSYVLAQPGYLKWQADDRATPRYTAATALRPATNGTVDVGATTVPRGSEGAFVFHFNAAYQGGTLTAQLLEIRTFEDSSVGSTRWSFDVMAGSQRLFSIPMRRLEDTGKPTTCRVLPDEGLQGSVKIPYGAQAELRVVGFKPN